MKGNKGERVKEDDYPLSKHLLGKFADYIEKTRTIPENETTEMLNEIHDAILSFLRGRSPYSFERGLEDGVEDEVSELRDRDG
mgnify:CR=1 FL=1